MFSRSRLLSAGILLTMVGAGVSFAAPRLTVAARAMQTPLQLAPFTSIQVPHGGHLVVRPGPASRVTFVQGSPEFTRVAVNGGVLVIDKCREGCPRRYRFELEVTMPSITRLSLANGGRIQTQGSFPRQQDFSVAVSHGGLIDVRSMAVDRVTATVEQGGSILTVPRASLMARVSNGGVITYWGEGRVTSSIQKGGVVQKGEASEINLPLSDAGFSFPPPRRRH
jgi:hypothetical protein